MSQYNIVPAGQITSRHLGNIVEFSWVDPEADAILCQVTGLLQEVHHCGASMVVLVLRANEKKAGASRHFRIRTHEDVDFPGDPQFAPTELEEPV